MAWAEVGPERGEACGERYAEGSTLVGWDGTYRRRRGPAGRG
ncbi:hypothetical protein ABQE62_11160 [Mycolicibacterium fortuitum]